MVSCFRWQGRQFYFRLNPFMKLNKLNKMGHFKSKQNDICSLSTEKNAKPMIFPFMILEDFFFYLGFMANQDFFTHFDLSQSLGGAKMRDPWENTPDHPQAELGLSHMWPEVAVRWSDLGRVLNFSITLHYIYHIILIWNAYTRVW